jgi:hypothetical protein
VARPEQGYGGYGYAEQGSQPFQGNESQGPGATEGFAGPQGPGGYAGPQYSDGGYQEPDYQESRGQSYPDQEYAGEYGGYAEQDYSGQGPAQLNSAHGASAPSYQDQGYSTFGYGGRDQTEYRNPSYEDRGYEDRGYEDRGYEDRGYEDRGYEGDAGQPGGYRELAQGRGGRVQYPDPDPESTANQQPISSFPYEGDPPSRREHRRRRGRY